MSVNDFKKALTAEDVIRRYNLNNLSSDRKKIKQATETLVKTDKELKSFIDATAKNIENIQSQVDGNITTWFLIGVPTIENQPANEWLTDKDKNNHLGDLYYDQDTGYAYRFALENNEYKWLKITDTDVTEALAIANSAKDTADSKRRVFVVLPTPPYDIGDIWIKDDKDLYRCRAKRSEGDYNAVDWVLATDYSNDDYAKGVEAVLNQFKTTVEKDYVTNVKLETTKDSIESSVSSVTTKVEKVKNDMGDVISTVTSQNEKISKITQTTDEINSKISDIADITTSGESQRASVNLVKVNESEPIAIKIHPISEDISYLYPSDYLYPADDLYLMNRIIRFTNTDTNEVVDYELPDDLLYYDANNYDEFILNYDSQTCSIIKRIEYIKETNKNAIKTTEETINYDFPTIALSAGNYTVSLPGYSNAYIYVQLMASNIYTTQFATKIEMSSEISQTKESINSEVSKKVGKTEIISTINQTAEAVTIDASKINIGGTISAINNNTTSTINGNKITTGSITADKVSSDIITTRNFSAQEINADKITSGTISTSRLAVDVITTGNFSAQKINADNITAGTISTSRLDSDVITTGNFSAQKINADNITAGTISTSRLDSDVITTSNFSAQNINAEKITAGVLNADRIPNISASKITSGTMSANRISGGSLNIGNNTYYLRMKASGNGYTNNPSCSGLTIGNQGLVVNSTAWMKANTNFYGYLNIFNKNLIRIYLGEDTSSSCYTAAAGKKTLTAGGHSMTFYNGLLVAFS